MDAAHQLLGWYAAGMATAVGGLWAVISYLQNKSLEYKRTFNDRQLEIVLLAAQTAGDLIGAKETSEWMQAKERFWELYWGRLVLFEDDNIVVAMKALGEKLDNGVLFADRNILRRESYAVSRALRDFLAEKNRNDWKISFANLTTRKAELPDSNAKLK